MKKIVSILIAVLFISGSYMLSAGENLDVKVNDLQLKLERVKKINHLEKLTAAQQKQIAELTKNLKDTSNSLSVANEEVKSSEIQINNLNSNISTLRKLKAQLEKETLETQKTLTVSYDSKIKQIQNNNKEKLNTLLAKYNSDSKDALDKSIKEKSELISSYEAKIKSIKSKADDSYNSLLDKYNKETTELQKQLASTRSDLTDSYENKIKDIQSENLDKHNKLLAKYDKDTKSLKFKLDDANDTIEAQNKKIQDFKDKISTDESTIVALNTTVNTLSSQKKQLEDDLNKIQNQTIADYKKQIADINAASEARIASIKNQYAKLSAKNNHETEIAKAQYETKLEADKKILREQLDNLIKEVNSKQNEIFRTAQYIAENSDEIGSAAANLKKAYGDLNPYKKTTLLQNIGIEKANPSWGSIIASNDNLRKNITTLRAISDELAKDNLNNKTLLDENQNKDKGFLGIF